MSNGSGTPAANRDKPKLRHEFVGMMFALAIGEVGLQAAALLRAGNFSHLLPAYAHLALATIVIATSWVGWSLSLAPGGREDVGGILQWEFVVLLLDVVLVVMYFILVRTIDFSKAGDFRVDAASTVASLVFWIFVLYFAWDVITKIVIYFRKKKSEREGDWTRKYGLRMLPTAVCLGVAWLVLQCVKGSDALHKISADFALLCLILLFRALKDLVSAYFPSPTSPKKLSQRRALVWTIVLSFGVVYGTLATAYRWPLPLSGDVINDTSARTYKGSQKVRLLVAAVAQQREPGPPHRALRARPYTMSSASA